MSTYLQDAEPNINIVSPFWFYLEKIMKKFITVALLVLSSIVIAYPYADYNYQQRQAEQDYLLGNTSSIQFDQEVPTTNSYSTESQESYSRRMRQYERNSETYIDDSDSTTRLYDSSTCVGIDC